MPNRPITTKEKQAWDFAKDLHKSQVRKFIGLPYFDAHVQKVNGIVKQYTKDEDLLIAALLHDTLEDCYEDVDVGYHEIKELFGLRVANLVKELTSDGDELDTDYSGNKTDYLIDKMINMTDDAMIIKLADRLQNISDAFTASEKFRNKYFIETTNIIREVERHRTLNKIQNLLIGEIKSKLSNISSIFKLESLKNIKSFKNFNNKD
jgi:(p)ppGpp synthase/HD superfamily hydrolase